SGDIELAKGADHPTVVVQMQTAIRNYIFPALSQSSYSPITSGDTDINQIFNGPLLHNGWIATASVGEKRNMLRAYELIPIIQSIPGVISVSGLFFSQMSIQLQTISCEKDQLLFIDVVNSPVSFCSNGNALSTPLSTANFILSNTAKPGAAMPYSLKPKNYISVPKGNYRDINTYYSIQNTFPAIFGIGNDSITAAASNIQLAQSRQLKGYLTLFDQVLANQFSQLANINRLFSFKNSVYGAPSDLESFLAFKDKFERRQQEYPVPYMVFSPTYYYQSLYNIPHIAPLLKDAYTFKFNSQPEAEKELAEQNWIAYQQDPYNAYMAGLMAFMEDEDTSLARRNEMLDHLLARHGESPLLMDMIITGTIYSGNSLKDKVVIKSLYLQNLGALSYNRQKGYNYLGAYRLAPGREDTAPVDLPAVTNSFFEKIIGGDTIDSVFNSGKINRIAKIRERDFINYSAIELKLSLLFGLRVYYINYIIRCFREAKTQILEHLYPRQALWFLERRRGFIMIEMTLLLNCFGFNVYLAANTQTGPFYQVTDNLDYTSAFRITNALNLQITDVPFAIAGRHYLYADRMRFTVKQLTALYGDVDDYNIIDGQPYYIFMETTPVVEKMSINNAAAYNTGLELFFPDFIGEFKEKSFTDRLDLFLQANLPIGVSYNYHFVAAPQLESLINDFTLWHESMRYTTNGSEKEEKDSEHAAQSPQNGLRTACAEKLVATIREIYDNVA
ncbi:MAG: hypothetical protein M3N14_00495, partial [Bacteroidota bacterium]|nr:hypothetical protein [Bacteroidota bacterium]